MARVAREQLLLLDVSVPIVSLGDRPDLASYHAIFANMSVKDAFAMLDTIVPEVQRLGLMDRLWTVHADLGLIEWPGVTHNGVYWPSNRELVAQQSAAYGIPPERHLICWRKVIEADGIERMQTLLEYIIWRRKFPDPARRFCTSDVKTTKIDVALTPIIEGLRRSPRDQVRVLHLLGMRAQESAAREAHPVYSSRTSNSSRQIDVYLPIHSMEIDEVKARIAASGVPYHWTYDSEPGALDWGGMSRLSCSFCIMANKRDLMLAVLRRPRLADLYARVEEALGHNFRDKTPIRTLIQKATLMGPEPGIILDELTPEFDTFEAEIVAALASDVAPRGGTGYITQAEWEQVRQLPTMRPC